MASDNGSLDIDKEVSEVVMSWLAGVKSEYQSKYGSVDEWDKEKDTLAEYGERLLEELEEDYEIEEPIGLGSTAVVTRIHHISTSQKLALKVNRPLDDPDDVSRVKNEADHLPEFNHTNIIKCIDRGMIDDIEPPASYLIEPLVSNPVDLDKFIQNKKEKVLDLRAEGGSGGGEVRKELNDSLQKLVSYFRQISEAIAHMHSRGFVHLDVKPENALVSDDGHITLIDLGSVEELSEDEQSVPVYFTERYGHPNLVSDHEGKTSSNRLKAGRKKSELTPDFDYYALGQSILESLNRLGMAAPNDAPQLPKFKSLHLLGTRLLTAENSHSRGVPEGEIVTQFYGRLTANDYNSLRYRNLENAIEDFKKEEGLWNLEQKVPELNDYSKDVLRLNPDLNIVLTERLLKIIEHPLFARLKLVRQLGLITFLYPSADHARFDHVIGTYRRVCSYVKSLFNDEHNPLFRNLVREEDIKAVLLTSLLHDLGQYPLAHDLEEVHDEIFSHESLSLELINHETEEGYTNLSEIIENDQWGWGVDTGYIQTLLGVNTPGFETDAGAIDFKVDMLTALIDGPIDADKADYIIRDTEEAGLRYGKQLDFDRLLRTITVVRLEESGSPRKKRVTVGVYDKGFPTAQSFGQARYELISTVYWHHTARSVKTMTQYAVSDILFGDQSPSLDQTRKDTIKSQLLDLVISMTPVHPVQDIVGQTELATQLDDSGYDVESEPAEEVFDDFGDEEPLMSDPSDQYPEGAWHPGVGWTDSLMLDWLSHRQEDNKKAKQLLSRIKSRDLYKRVIEVEKNVDNERLVEAVRNLSWEQKLELQKDLQNRVLTYVESNTREIWGNSDGQLTLSRGSRETDTLIHEPKDRISTLLEDEMSILVDVPVPRDKLGYEPKDELVTVPTLQTKQYYQEIEQIKRRRSWTGNLEDMLETASPVRIYAHSDLRRLLCSQIGPTEMKEFLWDAVEEVSD